MADLPIWLDGGDHMCCGEPRHVGQTVRLALAFSRAGKVQATSEPDQITVHGDATVTIIGTADGKTDIDGPFGHGSLIQSGNVQFAIHGDPPGPKVRCTGELYEARHGEPAGTTTGQLIAIRWRPQEALTGTGPESNCAPPATGASKRRPRTQAPGHSSSRSKSATKPPRG